MIWFTSDPHFSHANIIKFCSRPFSSDAVMDYELIKKWNQVVAPDDEVYILGDVSWMSTKNTIKTLSQLNGSHLYLIVGNHDHHHLKDPVFRNRFEWVKDYYELRHNNRLYVLSHYPFLSWRESNRGSVNLCGHRHLGQQEDNVLRFDVGVDANNYAPVSIDYIEKWAHETRNKIKASFGTENDRRGTGRNNSLESYPDRRKQAGSDSNWHSRLIHKFWQLTLSLSKFFRIFG